MGIEYNTFTTFDTMLKAIENKDKAKVDSLRIISERLLKGF